MPCCSYDFESWHRKLDELSSLTWFVDELDGKKVDLNKRHKDVEGGVPTKEWADQLTATLCEKCQLEDVSKYSLELQIWWRDHQIADKERFEKEARENALSKLTPYERKLLGW